VRHKKEQMMRLVDEKAQMLNVLATLVHKDSCCEFLK